MDNYQQETINMIKMIEKIITDQCVPDSMSGHEVTITYRGLSCTLLDQPAVVEAVIDLLEQLIIEYPTYYC